jgi:hypothetical protein
MTRDLILHIGTTKTGSSSIQNVLFKHRAALREQGVLYPSTPGDAQHDLLAYAMMENHAQRNRMETGLWRGMTPDARIEQFLQDFPAEINAAPASIRRVVLSTEFIYILLRKPSEVQRLHDLLRPLFSSIKVVVYLRRQDAHFTSLYTQLLRSGEVVAPDQLKMKPRPLHELDYAKMLERWAAVFGSQAILPRLFEQPASGRFDAVQDFLDICGITLPDAAETAADVNTSINLAGQLLLVDVGRLIQAQRDVRIVSGPVWKSLTDAVTAAAPGRGWRPTRAAAEAFYGDFKQSNEAVRSAWFPDRATLFTEDFDEYPEQAVAVGQDALYATACATLVKLAQREHERTIRAAHDAVRQARTGGNPARLRTALQRAIRADPGHVGVRVMLADLHLDANEPQKARGLLNAAQALDAEDAGVRKLAARLGGAGGGDAGSAPVRKSIRAQPS